MVSMKTKRSFCAGLVTLFTAITAAPNVAGQEGDSGIGIIEEILVTAQKREQSIQDVGIAITAFTGDQIDRFGFEQSTDIARMTPGLHISNNEGGKKQLFNIRGVNQNAFTNQTESPIAVYTDEAYVAVHQVQLFALFDTERVEVLKGPQGTLFGRNATGGLVHFISRKPTRELAGYGEVSYGSYDQFRFEGAVGGPISDSLAGRVAILYNTHGEVFENTYPEDFQTINGSPLGFGREDTWNDDTLALRGHLLFELNEDVDVLLTANYGRTRSGVPAQFEVPAVPVFNADGVQIDTVRASPTEIREAIGPGGVALDNPLSFDADTTRPVPGGTLFGPTCSSQGFEDIRCSMDFGFDDIAEDDTYSVSAKITWKIDDLTLTSITSYQNLELYHTLDADGGPASTLSTSNVFKADTVTQELRLDSELEHLQWVAGAYFLHIDSKPNFSLNTYSQSLWLPLFGGTPVSVAIRSRQETESWSVFGQLEFDFANSLTFIAGLRIISEKGDFSTEETVFLNSDPRTLQLDEASRLFSFIPRREFNQDKTLWNGKAQINWQPTDDWLIYAGVTRGVKSGGFNSTVTFGAPFDDTSIPYTEETLLAFEAGFKGDLFGERMRFNGSFYYYDYSDYQSFQFRTAGGLITNVDAKNKGFELELISRPLKGLDLSVSLAYLDAKVSDVVIGPGVFVDSKPSFSPEFQAAGQLRYQWGEPVFGGRFSVQADFNYVSSVFGDVRNFQAHKLDSYIIGNLSLGWESTDATWNASFFVQNIADERYTIVDIDLANLWGSVADAWGRPRWFGASLRYSF